MDGYLEVSKGFGMGNLGTGGISGAGNFERASNESWTPSCEELYAPTLCETTLSRLVGAEDFVAAERELKRLGLPLTLESRLEDLFKEEALFSPGT